MQNNLSKLMVASALALGLSGPVEAQDTASQPTDDAQPVTFTVDQAKEIAEAALKAQSVTDSVIRRVYTDQNVTDYYENNPDLPNNCLPLRIGAIKLGMSNMNMGPLGYLNEALSGPGPYTPELDSLSDNFGLATGCLKEHYQAYSENRDLIAMQNTGTVISSHQTVEVNGEDTVIWGPVGVTTFEDELRRVDQALEDNNQIMKKLSDLRTVLEPVLGQ